MSIQDIERVKIDGEVPADPSAIEDFCGYEGLDPSVLIIPRVKVVQPTSKEGTSGTFAMNLTSDELQSINVAVIKAMRGRVMWDREDPGAERPLCRSYDFMVPDPTIEDPPFEKCADYRIKNNKRILVQICPKSKWIREDGQDLRPACDEVFNLLCINLEGNLPFWLPATGASIAPVRRFISAIALQKKRLWEFETTIGLIEKKDPHKHYVLNFSAPKRMTDTATLETIKTMVSELRDASFQQTVEYEEAQADKNENEKDMPGWVNE